MGVRSAPSRASGGVAMTSITCANIDAEAVHEAVTDRGSDAYREVVTDARTAVQCHI